MGHAQREAAIQIIRAGGWHHALGQTMGGTPYEAILCKRCAREEHKRPPKKPPLEQDETLPLNWEEWRHIERGEGFQSR